MAVHSPLRQRARAPSCYPRCVPSVAGYDLTGWDLERRVALASALREVVEREGYRMQAVGSSMEPTLPGGSWLDVVGLPTEIPLGALLLFVPEQGAQLICHRVVERTEEGALLVAGDRGGRPDHRVAASLAVGLVDGFVLGGRRFGPAGPPPSTYRRLRARLERALARLAGR